MAKKKLTCKMPIKVKIVPWKSVVFGKIYCWVGYHTTKAKPQGGS